MPDRGPQRPPRGLLWPGRHGPVPESENAEPGLHLLLRGFGRFHPGPRGGVRGDRGGGTVRPCPGVLHHGESRVGHRRGTGAESPAHGPRLYGAGQPVRAFGAERGPDCALRHRRPQRQPGPEVPGGGGGGSAGNLRGRLLAASGPPERPLPHGVRRFRGGSDVVGPRPRRAYPPALHRRAYWLQPDLVPLLDRRVL